MQEVYDIGTLQELQAKIGKVWFYVSMLNIVDPRGGWHAGTTYSYMPRVINIEPGVFALVNGPKYGVIFYQVFGMMSLSTMLGLAVLYANRELLAQLSVGFQVNVLCPGFG